MNNLEAYDKGFIDGLKLFAWWKDGKEVCGTSEIPLRQAIEERKKSFCYSPPSEEPK